MSNHNGKISPIISCWPVSARFCRLALIARMPHMIWLACDTIPVSSLPRYITQFFQNGLIFNRHVRLQWEIVPVKDFSKSNRFELVLPGRPPIYKIGRWCHVTVRKNRYVNSRLQFCNRLTHRPTTSYQSQWQRTARTQRIIDKHNFSKLKMIIIL